MPWKKSPPALIEAFDAALPRDPRAERRSMFGYPCAFVHGQMFTGLHEDRMIVRLDDRGRTELLAIPGAEPFEPLPGRLMKEYVVVPPRIVESGLALREWVERAFAYALSLPPKEKKLHPARTVKPAPARQAARPAKAAAKKKGKGR
jgi:TfoX/Sxy family transcriptional regulator of competence genes